MWFYFDALWLLRLYCEGRTLFLSPCVFTKRLNTAAHPWPELSGGREENKTKLRRSGGRLSESEELFPSERGVKSRRAAAAPGPERPPERDFFYTSFDFSVGGVDQAETLENLVRLSQCDLMKCAPR